jgi:putative phosphoesterase
VKIGVISDTHGFIDPSLPLVFRDVDHILHAGDIGSLSVIDFLEQIAPVTAVNGNNDWNLTFPYYKTISIGQTKIFLTHNLRFSPRTGVYWEKIFIENPEIIVFGHTHKATAFYENGKLFLNPGYAGQHNQWKRSVAIIHIRDKKPEPEIIPLGQIHST